MPLAGLDFTGHVERLCRDICARMSEFSHVDMDLVGVRYCQTRRAGRFGMHASLTPLRFAGGALETTRRGRRWTIERVCDPSGRELLYLLSFYLPRFLDQPLDEKLATICHELWHISPAFDGDLRRHGGRCYAHGSSERKYHAAMQQLARDYVQAGAPRERFEFLTGTFREIQARYGGVYGMKIRSPRLIPATGGSR